ncbi:hypothetical protein ACN6AT_35480 (plasmid) [Streptomyces sp. JL4002]|uniref:hypothetical protein n=1 Tax=Streptomyces sp. JL4002 TaxID=3404781 RepID=UPI003B2843E0
MIHASLVCQGCSGTLYAVATKDGAASLPTWKVDHDHTPPACPLRSLLPLEGTAAHIQELPHADHVLKQPA